MARWLREMKRTYRSAVVIWYETRCDRTGRYRLLPKLGNVEKYYHTNISNERNLQMYLPPTKWLRLNVYTIAGGNSNGQNEQIKL